MPKPIGRHTTRRVAAKVNSAERRFRECWRLLQAWRSLAPRSGASLLHRFQPRLFATLLDLQEYRQLILAEQRDVVASKATMPRWLFAKRVRRLAAAMQAVDSACTVGKSLGDAFVWPFYSNSRRLLEKHRSLQSQPYVPSGVGGRAILKTMETFSTLAGCFLVFHDISTILRLGDFSMYDPSSRRIEAVGEIKADIPKSGKLDVRMSLIGKSPNDRWVSQLTTMIPSGPMPPSGTTHGAQHDRYRRQVARIGAAISSFIEGAENQNMDAPLSYHHESLAQVLAGLNSAPFSSAPASVGVSVLGVRVDGKRLYDRVAGSFAGLPPQADAALRAEQMRLMLRGSCDNTLILSPLHYGAGGAGILEGMAPTLWWSIPAEMAERIYMQKVAIFTLYNRAHFLAACRDAGFTPSLDANGRATKLTWQDNNYRGTIQGLTFFETMIAQYLVDELSLVALLQRIRDEHLRSTGAVRIDLRFLQSMGFDRVAFSRRRRKQTSRVKQ